MHLNNQFVTIKLRIFPEDFVNENEDEGFMIGLEKRIYLSRGYIVKLIPHLPTFYVLEIL